MQKISIIIPVFNSENTLGKLVQLIISELGHDYNLEIFLVNDCSTDNSESICINLFNNHQDIVNYLSLAKNVGEHNAVMAGLNHCSGDWAVVMDDDFQNPISEVKKLISFALSNNFDVIYTFYAKKRHSWFRNMGSWFNDKVANYMLNKPKDLYLSSFKIINKYIINEIITYNLPFPYIDGLILRTTNNIGKIEVEHHHRRGNKSSYTIKKLISLWLNMFTNFSIIPLRSAILLGLIFSVIGLLLGVIAIVEKILNPEVPQGYTSLIVIISIFAGVQLIAIGVVGEYLGRIFLSQNKKPQYTIRKKYFANGSDS